MQFGYVLLQVLLGLFVDPLLEVVEVKSMRISDLSGLLPLDEKGEVVSHLLPVEDTVDHMAAEQTQFNFVTSVRMDLLVLMDSLENVGSRGSVGKLQLLKGLLIHLSLVPLSEVLNRHLAQHVSDLTIHILKV